MPFPGNVYTETKEVRASAIFKNLEKARRGAILANYIPMHIQAKLNKI